MNEFEKWLKRYMCNLWGELDLYTNTEAIIIYKRAKRLHQDGATKQQILDFLDECQNPNSRN